MPWRPPWLEPRFGPPPDVIYPGYQQWNPYGPSISRHPEGDIDALERELEDLEDDRLEIERRMEDVKRDLPDKEEELVTARARV